MGSHTYDSAWLGRSQSMIKSILSIMYRSQKPFTISVSGFFPALSLFHCASVTPQNLEKLERKFSVLDFSVPTLRKEFIYRY